MKNSKIRISIFGMVLSLILTVGMITGCDGGDAGIPGDTSGTDTDLQIPDIPDDTTEEDDPAEIPDIPEEPSEPDESTADPETSGNLIVKPNEEMPEITGEAEEPVTPVETVRYEEPEDTEPAGKIIIGGGDPEHEKYDCQTPNHHCDGPETHAYISNLELNGCPFCGSHACPSFYAVDLWGYARYDPSRCPEYSVKNDPLHYCQECGKRTGDGSGGTCVTFNTDISCPLCGEQVKAWECHTCG